MGFDRIDQMEALLGSEQFRIGPHDIQPEMVRKPNGFWSGPKGRQNTRVSAVLFCQVAPWNVHEARLCLYHNPWAAAPYQGTLNRLPQAVPQALKMTWVDGMTLADLFQLTEGWLGEN
jgi:hypothetical protein